jgi:hypothetical protein
MAADAQKAANRAIKDAKGDMNKALSLFDSRFSSLYIAHPMKTYRDAIDMYQRRGAQVFGTSHNRGSTGFRDQYLDSENGHISRGNNVDQTHHFAVYFSGGINGQWAATTAHAEHDYYANNNVGDYNLGNTGYNLGSNLASNPNQLQRIGDIIRNTICNRG